MLREAPNDPRSRHAAATPDFGERHPGEVVQHADAYDGPRIATVHSGANAQGALLPT